LLPHKRLKSSNEVYKQFISKSGLPFLLNPKLIFNLIRQFFIFFLFEGMQFHGKSREVRLFPYVVGSHGKAGEVHLFPNFLKKLPAKSWVVMVSHSLSAEFRGQRGGGYIHTDNFVRE
jgi:hypothetical protein